jgi:DNA repair protein RadC
MKMPENGIWKFEPKWIRISDEDAVTILRKLIAERPLQEAVWVLLLNGANKAVGYYMATLGLVNSSQLSSAEVFKGAITSGALSVILAHNHPSGTPSPSPEDIEATKDLLEAGKALKINLLDHLIITQRTYQSMRGTNPELWS